MPPQIKSENQRFLDKRRLLDWGAFTSKWGGGVYWIRGAKSAAHNIRSASTQWKPSLLGEGSLVEKRKENEMISKREIVRGTICALLNLLWIIWLYQNLKEAFGTKKRRGNCVFPVNKHSRTISEKTNTPHHPSCSLAASTQTKLSPEMQGQCFPAHKHPSSSGI